jgi:hypothetical protein
MLAVSTKKQGIYRNREDAVLKPRKAEKELVIENDYYLKPDADLARAITGEQLLERLIPRIEQLFDK